MIRVRGGSATDFSAVHIFGKDEIAQMTEITSLTGTEWFMVELPAPDGEHRKIAAQYFAGPGSDTTAYHKTVSGEIDGTTLIDAVDMLDKIVMEDESDGWAKKSSTSLQFIQAIVIDDIQDGSFFKRFSTLEQLKLATIYEYADVTADAIGSLPVNSLFDITSPGADIEDAVTKRHTQGTDTTLGVLTQNIDFGVTFKGVNAADPVDPQDYVTKNYMDTSAHDLNAVHLNGSSEIVNITFKDPPLDLLDVLLIEDKADGYDKKAIRLSSIDMDVLSDGILYKRFSAVEQTKLASITSTGADIDDAVAKRHTQGTDTTLGIQAQNVDFGTFRGVNAGDPVDPQDLVTLNFLSANYATLAGYQEHTFLATVETYWWISLASNIDTMTTFGNMDFILSIVNDADQKFETYNIKVVVPYDSFRVGDTVQPYAEIIPVCTNTTTVRMLECIYLSYDPVTPNRFSLLCKVDTADSDSIKIYDLVSGNIRVLDPVAITDVTPSPLTGRRLCAYRMTNKSTNDTWGSVKIISNGDTSEPTYNLVAGVEQQLVYTNPLLDANVYYPETAPVKDITSVYDDVGAYSAIFLENPVPGQAQYWRISLSYSNKLLLDNEGLYVKVLNPISGFTRRLLLTLPDGETSNDFLTIDISTYADPASLAPPLGTGTGGYQIWLQTVKGSLTVVIKDVTRLTY